MIEIKNKENCCGCGACVSTCKTNAISFINDEEGFQYPVIDTKKCVGCNKCNNVCPILNTKKHFEILDTYCGYIKNEKIRESSSSGGFFFAFAKKILDEGGVVFGAAFDENNILKQIPIYDCNDLSKLMGSKYIQSDNLETYEMIEKCLKEGKKVLYTGTPCQVAAIKNYIKCEKNLLCIDIICHGVPSPIVWEKYVATIENNANKKVKMIKFRDKSNGWKNFGMKLIFNDKSEFTCNKDEDNYMKAFLSNYDLRPSCYKCEFKEKNLRSDITIGDCWGIEEITDEFSDDKGTSLMIVRTEQGKQLIEEVRNELRLSKINYQVAKKYNSALVKSVYEPKERRTYILDSKKMSYEKLSKLYFSMKLKWRIYRQIHFWSMNK